MDDSGNPYLTFISAFHGKPHQSLISNGKLLVHLKEKRPGFPGRFHLLLQALMDQNLYFTVSCIDQRDTAVLPLSLLFSWIDELSVRPVKLYRYLPVAGSIPE